MKHEKKLAYFRFSILCGTLEEQRAASFERLIWRICSGNAFFRYNPETKCFFAIVQSSQLTVKVQKACKAFVLIFAY